MNARIVRILLLFFILGLGAGCANITAPTGGKKDTTPPKLLYVSPTDSQRNTRINRIDLGFDEYIAVSDVGKEVQVSPILPIAPTVIGKNKTVVVKIIDSLLESNTTYRISFGNAIKDIHEGNPFKGYTYTFSTGNYFDSLQLRGTVIDAATGLPDTGAIVELYSAKESDSAVVRHAPRYITKTTTGGAFVFKGLPERTFKIYALNDANNNLVYDGPTGGEMIAFNDTTVVPGDTSRAAIELRIFAEIADTAMKKKTDTSAKDKRFSARAKKDAKDASVFTVNLDTSTITKGTFDINHPIKLTLGKVYTLNSSKISLTYDSAGMTMRPPTSVVPDTLHPGTYSISPSRWKENTVYSLGMAKGFAQDTSSKELLPVRYKFRTFGEENYGKLRINIPAKYHSPSYILQITADKDTIYQKPITDTIVKLTRLLPAKYTFRIIVDKNGNGKWDTGDLLARIQPEEVIPFPEPVTVKAIWENVVDLIKQAQPVKGSMKDKLK